MRGARGALGNGKGRAGGWGGTGAGLGPLLKGVNGLFIVRQPGVRRR